MSKEPKEISIEDYRVTNDSVEIEFIHHNDFKELKLPISHLEDYVKENDLLEWRNMVLKDGEYVDDIEGKYEFAEWVKERLNSHIIKLFLISELEKMKST